jgi:hypothetical protein
MMAMKRRALLRRAGMWNFLLDDGDERDTLVQRARVVSLTRHRNSTLLPLGVTAFRRLHTHFPHTIEGVIAQTTFRLIIS